MLEEVLANGLAVLAELDTAIAVVHVQHGVQSVVVLARANRLTLRRGNRDGRGGSVHAACRPTVDECRVQNPCSPSLTARTSRSVPSNSNRYSSGTPHFAEITRPARQ